MKLLITSDWHADAKTLGHARYPDVEEAVRQTVRQAIDQKVDAYCFLGDLCDPDSGSAVFRSVELVIWAATHLARAGVTSIWLAGNHDVIEDGSGDTTLSPLRPIAREDEHVWLFEQPGTATFDIHNVCVHALPYTATSHPYDPEKAAEPIWSQGGTHVVLAHLSVEGVQPGEETKEMPRGRDVTFPRGKFTQDRNGVYLFNGHYHRQQVHTMPGFLPVHIPGAPARFTFGEQDNVPGCLFVEV
jgi:DNA repair exonuclease SbcCD nuclease subunit